MPLQWAALLALSGALSLAWGAAGMPAALLLGPMIGGIVFGVNGAELKVPRLPYTGAQAVIGAMIGSVITPAIFSAFARDWLLFCAVMAATMFGAAALGWLISRSGIIPGATAVYGTSPGAASSMVLLGEAQGADTQLIAFMQYSRVLLVALVAALVARFGAGHPAASAAVTTTTSWFAPVHWASLAMVLAIAVLSQLAGRALRLSAWALLGPMLVLSGLHASGLIEFHLPRWLLAACYALLGWNIGLGFRRNTLINAAHALLPVIASALALIAFCAGLSWCLSMLLHIDPLTAYLATSPGGLDSVAIIAASSPQVDMSFVMALQGVRLIFVIALAPTLVKLVVKSSPHLRQQPAPAGNWNPAQAGTPAPTGGKQTPGTHHGSASPLPPSRRGPETAHKPDR
ncbi:AbrB family transcriptional regulator [Nevskia soli]|uniref:AbrB family transcriptional regulator n=1 Tax=Nevskia soli TaxID=418856 RepID=UPI001B80412D|nr:AbrB family transcriptional regulator [Nevskia soli]